MLFNAEKNIGSERKVSWIKGLQKVIVLSVLSLLFSMSVWADTYTIEISGFDERGRQYYLTKIVDANYYENDEVSIENWALAEAKEFLGQSDLYTIKRLAEEGKRSNVSIRIGNYSVIRVSFLQKVLTNGRGLSAYSAFYDGPLARPR